MKTSNAHESIQIVPCPTACLFSLLLLLSGFQEAGRIEPPATESVLRFEQPGISSAGTYSARIAGATGVSETPPILVRLTTGLRLEAVLSPEGAVSL